MKGTFVVYSQGAEHYKEQCCLKVLFKWRFFSPLFCVRVLACHYNSLQKLKGKTGYWMEFVYGKAFYSAVSSAAWIEELTMWVGI